MGNRLAGKVIAVTGATKGIGKGIAMMCATEGASVVVNGRNEREGQQVVQDIMDSCDGTALFIQADISSEHLLRIRRV